MNIADLKKDIDQLPAKERASIAHWIITNLDEVDDNLNQVDAAWRKEIRKRVSEINTGKVEMIPSEALWKDLLSRYGKTG
jgi:putative addiction module component (TIGR02574 family)